MGKFIKLSTYIKAIVFVLLFSPQALAMTTNATIYTNTFMTKHVNTMIDNIDKTMTIGLTTTWIGLQTVDLLQSTDLVGYFKKGYYEKNPIYGLHPSYLTYDLLMPIVTGMTLGAGLAMPWYIKYPILGYGIYTEAAAIIGNAELGLTPLLAAVPTMILGIGIGILAGVISYYIVKEVITYFNNHQPAPFVSRPWPLKGETRP
jgi:hypothetical protein